MKVLLERQQGNMGMWINHYYNFKSLIKKNIEKRKSMRKSTIAFLIGVALLFTMNNITFADDWINLDESSLESGRIKGTSTPNTTLYLYVDKNADLDNSDFNKWDYIDQLYTNNEGKFDFIYSYNGVMDYKITSINSNFKDEKIFRIKDSLPNNFSVYPETISELTKKMTVHSKGYTKIELYIDSKIIDSKTIISETGDVNFDLTDATPNSEIKVRALFKNGEVKEYKTNINPSISDFVMDSFYHTTDRMNYFILNHVKYKSKEKLYTFYIEDESGKIISKNVVYDKKSKEYRLMMEKQRAGSKIYIYAKDQWGNKSKKAVVTVRDGVPPKIKLDSKKIYNSTTKITGTGEPGATVHVRTYDKDTTRRREIGKSKINSKGRFEVKIKKQKVGLEVSVTASDKSDNFSPQIAMTVKDNIPPSAPKVNNINYKSTKLSGISEKNSMVYVYKNNKLIGQNKTNLYSKFFIKIPTQKKRTLLLVTAMDESGNESKYSKVYVK